MSGTTCECPTDYFRAMAGLFEMIDHDAVEEYARLIFEAWRDRRTVFTFGNGGSAYTASHHVADYVKTAAVDGQPRLRAFSLVDNVGLSTALGNDIGYEHLFLYPLQTYAEPGDLAVALSCSGNSANVVRACRWAREHGMTTVAITGFTGGRLASIADLHIHLPSENYGVIEDLQMSIGHIAAQMLQRRIAVAERI